MRVLLFVLALAGSACAQQSTGFITQRAAERQRYETELKVSCDTGDDRACFELFLSINRMYLAIAAGVLGALILVSFCVCCCCCYKKKHRRLATSSHA